MSGTADLVPSVHVFILHQHAQVIRGKEGRSRKQPSQKTALHQLVLATRALVSESELQVMQHDSF